MGRRRKSVYDSYGNELFQNGGARAVRVQEDKANSTFILLDGKKKIRSSTDKAVIIAEFYRHIGKDAVDISADVKVGFVPTGSWTTLEDGKVVNHNPQAKLTPAAISQMFAELYYKNPATAEALSGIPNLAKLQTMDFNHSNKTVKISLDEILEAYCNSSAYSEKDWLLKEANKYWGEFRSIINKEAGHKIKYLTDINPAWIKTWEEEIRNVATRKAHIKTYWLSHTQTKKLDEAKVFPRNGWQRKRVFCIKGLLKHYKLNKIYDPNDPRMKQIQDLEYTLSTVKAFEKPKPLPKTIAPEIFKQLYDGASDRMKMILCLGVQCAFTPVDLFNLKQTDIDWKTGELSKMREKENKPRLAYISPALLKMMETYMNKHNGSTEYVVVENGARVTAKAITKEFGRLRAKLEIDSGVQFKQLRKTGITKAAKNGASDLAVKLFCGHSTGQLDAYLERTIDQIQDACITIAQEYFPFLEKNKQ